MCVCVCVCVCVRACVRACDRDAGLLEYPGVYRGGCQFLYTFHHFSIRSNCSVRHTIKQPISVKL